MIKLTKDKDINNEENKMFTAQKKLLGDIYTITVYRTIE